MQRESTWRQESIWRNEILFDALRFYLTQWESMQLKTIWRNESLFDAMRVYLMQWESTWRHESLFDAMRVYLTQWDYLTQRESTWRHESIWLAEKISLKRGDRYEEVARYMRVKLSFLTLKATLFCLRGSRSCTPLRFSEDAMRVYLTQWESIWRNERTLYNL